MHTATEKRAVIFMRARITGRGKQRDHVVEQQAVTVQRQRCLEMAQQLKATVVREYTEYGGTGDLNKRPVVRRLLDETRALRDAEYVITERTDRLTRRRDDRRLIDLELSASGAHLVTADDPHAVVREKGGITT